MEENMELLPISKVNGIEFLVDIAKREFRDFNDSKNVIKMHSPAGRRILAEIQGTMWNCAGISTGRETKAKN